MTLRVVELPPLEFELDRLPFRTNDPVPSNALAVPQPKDFLERPTRREKRRLYMRTYRARTA